MGIADQIGSRVGGDNAFHMLTGGIEQHRMQNVFKNDFGMSPGEAELYAQQYSPVKEKADAADRALQRYQSMLELGYKQAAAKSATGLAAADDARKANDSRLSNLRGGLGTLNTLLGEKGVLGGGQIDPAVMAVLMQNLQLQGTPIQPFLNQSPEQKDEHPDFY